MFDKNFISYQGSSGSGLGKRNVLLESFEGLAPQLPGSFAGNTGGVMPAFSPSANQAMFLPTNTTSAPIMSTFVPVKPTGVITNNTLPTTALPQKIIGTKNDLLLTGQSLLDITATIFDKDGVVPGVNISISGTNYPPTNINGVFKLKNISNLAEITFSFVGLKTLKMNAGNVPARILMEEATLVVASKKMNKFWVFLAVLGLAYGGYRYSMSKDKKIIKTKI